MPTYQYKCNNCGNEFEEFQTITEPPLEKCPRCGQKPRRIITGGAGFLLKGSGFYTTDYRSESYKAAAKKENQALSPAPTSTDTASKPKIVKPGSDKPQS